VCCASDRWYYVPSNNCWVFVAGSFSSVPWSLSQYGQFRVPSSTNSIPARGGSAAAIDLRNGRIYFFAGWNSQGETQLSDMLSYDIAANISTWSVRRHGLSCMQPCDKSFVSNRYFCIFALAPQDWRSSCSKLSGCIPSRQRQRRSRCVRIRPSCRVCKSLGGSIWRCVVWLW
jgi:hypothetical protein